MAAGLLLQGHVQHLLFVPMARIDLPSLQALSNAASFGQPTLVLHVSPEEAEANRFQAAWGRWGVHVPLAVVASPYRAVVGPIVNYLEELHAQRPDLNFDCGRARDQGQATLHHVLHDRLGERLRRADEHHEGIAMTDVPFHLLH